MNKIKRKTQQITPAAVSSKKSKLLPIILTVILAGAPFIAGKYIEFNSPGAFDSGSNVYSAVHVLRGAKLGTDEKPGAQPGTLLVNILGAAVFGYDENGAKTVQLIMQAAALIFMFITLQKFFSPSAAIISTAIASLCLSSPLIAKYGNVKEQYMTALMIMGICCLIYRHNGGKWFWAALSGAFLSWAITFKQTGLSAAIAAGLFIIAQPLLKNRTAKQIAADIGLLFAGAAVSLVPVYIWLLVWHGTNYLPYQFVFDFFVKKQSLGDTYISKSRELTPFAEQFARTMRYYNALILPISLAAVSLLVRFAKWLRHMAARAKIACRPYDKFVLLLGVWWLLDMAFVWISPRSYEEYYIPLNGSGAMLAGYIIALYSNKFGEAKNKIGWFIGGVIGLFLLITMAWPLVFGISKSPHSGASYGRLNRGYVQRLQEISQRKEYGLRAEWELAAAYIKENTTEQDTIFVWGWVPGIYLKSQRLSCTNKPFTSEMHIISPQELKIYVEELVSDLQSGRPKYIVDTQNRHYPWDRPPLGLWPTPDDTQYRDQLAEKIGQDEAERFDVMKHFRDFMTAHYRLVQKFGQIVVFVRKEQ